MNREYESLAKYNARWQRRNLSRLMAIAVMVLTLVAVAMRAYKSGY